MTVIVCVCTLMTVIVCACTYVHAQTMTVKLWFHDRLTDCEVVGTRQLRETCASILHMEVNPNTSPNKSNMNLK